VGVHPDVKEKIFKRQYYQNTGFGLFLSGEILSITDISIKETGIYGEGARFEIFIPDSNFRISQ
jgi:sensor histidine kinase regulating citrate/malate metabolism